MAGKKKVSLGGIGAALVLAGAALVEKGNMESGIILVVIGLVLVFSTKLLK